MINKNCLSEEDLILHYYQELSVPSEETLHLASCSECEERLNSLRLEMAALPDWTQKIDPYAGSRMAARVSERLKPPRKNWLPAIGTTAIAGVALLLAVTLWSPQEKPQLTTRVNLASLADNPGQEMSDIDFLEDFELLRELELLRQIEGV